MYQIIIKKKAKKFIEKLPINEHKRIVNAIEQFLITDIDSTKTV